MGHRFPVVQRIWGGAVSAALPEREKTMTKISTIRHYKIRKDGSLRFVGIETREVEETHVTHIAGLAERDEADAIRRARELEDFEALADAACACGE